MPSYLIHLATCSKQALESRSFELGVETPDLLKKYFKTLDREGAIKKYESIRTFLMPDFEELEPRIRQKEVVGRTDGLHYGVSSLPDVVMFWKERTQDQKDNPFYRGYAWHLLTDALIYNKLDINHKLCQGKITKEQQEEEKRKLHAYWDKINVLVQDKYPEVKLSDEIKELGVINFDQKGDLVYVDWNVVSSEIDYLRTFDPLDGNMDQIIDEVLSRIN